MNVAHVFEKWLAYNREYLEKCRGKYVAVTLSAGKDSSTCLHFLNETRAEFGYDLGAFLYAFPRHRYTPEFREKLLPFWAERGIEVVWRETTTEDTILEQADNPCRPCQDLRKSELPKIFAYLKKKPEELVIVSGHSLWDLAGYALNRFVADKLAASTNYQESFSQDRFVEISQRFYPFLSMKGGYSVYRPMLFLNLEEIKEVCDKKMLPVLGIPCRYAQRRPKKMLGEYFMRFGYQFDYPGVLAFAQKYINIAGPEKIQSISQEEYLSRRF